MRTVSNDIKTALNQYTTQRKGRIKVNNTYYDIYNVTYYTDAYDEGKVIGNAIATQLEFDIPYVSKFDEFIYYDGIWTGEEYEYVEIGVFTVFDDKDENEFTKHITAFDNMIKFNAPYEANSTYPITLYQELQNICTQAGVTLINDSIPNGDFIVENNQFVNEETLKTVLKAICTISGTFATIKNDSIKLQLKNTTDVAITKYQHEPVTWKRRSYGINQVILGMENVTGEYVMREDPDDIALHGVHKLVINDNPFAYTQEKRAALIDDLFDQVKGFGYIPYELKGEWLNYLEVGDTITIDNIETLVLRINAKSPDSLKTEMSAPAIIDNSIEYVNNTESIENRMNRTEIIVDKNTQEIKEIAEKVVDVSKTVEGIGQIQLEGANPGVLHSLEIRGNISLLFPTTESLYGYSLMISDDFIVNNNIYISDGVPYNNEVLYPSSTLYPKDSLLQVDEEYYRLDIDYLNYINETTYDKYVYQDGKQWIERNVGIDSNGDMYPLTNTIIENRKDISINVDSESILKLLSFGTAILKCEYLLENQYTQVFATEAYVNSEIRQTTDEIEIKVATKVNQDEVISAINLSREQASIKSNKIALEGYTTINNGFSIDLDGNMTCNDANINGDIVTSNGVLTNLQYQCETWGWNRANSYDYFNGGFIGYQLEIINTGGTTTFGAHQSYLNFCVDIPEYFTVKSAKIRLRHSPMDWRNRTLTDMQKGSCKNLKVYNAYGLGYSGYGNYGGEFVIGGSIPSFTELTTEPASLTFSDSNFEEKEFELPISVFNTNGVHNIVVKSTDAIPTGVDGDNAYQKLGSKTGILTGTLELIGYTNNV